MSWHVFVRVVVVHVRARNDSKKQDEMMQVYSAAAPPPLDRASSIA